MNLAERVGRSAGGTLCVARCLGHFRLQDQAGNQLQFRTRKARALLAVLAVHGRPMPRSAIADLLWSDRAESQARASLRQTLFELQHLQADSHPLLVIGREDVSTAADALVTDLQLIRTASANGDWPRLLTLLESSDSGLLSDLDGLDPELDDWLRLQRAHEPAKTIAAAVDAVERCANEAGAGAALDLTGEILRLDPVNEEATRLAMRLARELGDTVAVHRHFAALKDRLREDYDTEPSTETLALLKSLSAPGAKPGPPRAETDPNPEAVAWKSRKLWMLSIAVAGALVLLLAGAWFRYRDAGTASHRHLIVAVLPFEQQPAGDTFLADGLWEDTRAALSRNSALQVLGPATTRAMAAQHFAPDQYRRRLGVDYVLEGDVRRAGEQVLVSVTLTRTADGVSVWDHAFKGRLGDPLALQDAIANGIEGRLRGRLAPGGGHRAEEIATTPEVYSLYSEGRSLLRSRSSSGARQAQLLLQKAVSLDPNYAPAWAALAETYHFVDYTAGDASARRARALAYARHALALAPGLAQAHAAYGFFLGDGSPDAERELRLAVSLDPGRVEAWNWLGNTLSAHLRPREAAVAYERAVAIDPIWPPAVGNLEQSYSDLNEQKSFERLVTQVRRAGGSEDLVAALQTDNAASRGDLSGAVAPVLRMRREKRLCDWACYEAGNVLIQLGYVDEGVLLMGGSKEYASMLSGRAPPPSTMHGTAVHARDFWLSPELSQPGVRALVDLGRERDLLKLYREAFASTDDAAEQLRDSDQLADLSPTIAIALRRTGHPDEATRLLEAAARPLEPVAAAKGGFPRTPAVLARIRAVQGRNAEALQLLSYSLSRGWLPNGIIEPVDLAQDPAFHDLRGGPRFEALRKQILDHIARERAELGPLKL